MIRNRRPVEADLFCDLLMRQSKLILKMLECLSPLHWIQIFALDIFDDRPLGSRTIINILDDSRYSIKANNLCRTQPSLTCNQLISTTSNRPNHDWLHDASSPDRVSE
tara:strand:+ start:12290 stop:12613 length:324 start_codon:yes stop_codon:yes gene_type:complete